MQGRSLAALSDDDLFRELKRLVALEREATVEVLRHLAELDRRRAVENTATPSLFVYCVRELGYSEGAAYRRIHAARCARDFPRIYVLLKRGRLTLTTVSLLAPHLRPKNCRELLARAAGMTKYEVEKLVAELAPRREMRELIRPLGRPPAPPPPETAQAALPMTSDKPAAADDRPQFNDAPAPPTAQNAVPEAGAKRVEFRFYADEAFLSKLRRAQAVLWHKHPRGRLEDILDEAVEALLDKRDPWRRIARKAKRRMAAAGTPEKTG